MLKLKLNKAPRINLLGTIRFQSTNSDIIKLTFFTKPDCMLCHEANEILQSSLNSIRPEVRNRIGNVNYLDITKDRNKPWFDCYRYDIPVLHIEREGCKKVVFMHRFNQEELVDELDQEL